MEKSALFLHLINIFIEIFNVKETQREAVHALNVPTTTTTTHDAAYKQTPHSDPWSQNLLI